MYSEWRKQQKYFDLCINVGDENIFVHKSLICEKSEFIVMLLVEKPWPPVNFISLKLPEEVHTEDIKSAIDFLYDKTTSNPFSAITGMKYLLVSVDVFIKIIKKYFSKTIDEQNYKQCINNLIETHSQLVPHVLPFFGVDLECAIPDELIVFGREIKPTGKKAFLPATESKMFYFRDINRRSESFEFCGLIWSIYNFTINPYTFDKEMLCKIYVHEECEAVEKIKIRATMCVFGLGMKPLIETKTEVVDPQNFKRKIMSKNFLCNKLTFSSIDHDIRASLLMEKIF